MILTLLPFFPVIFSFSVESPSITTSPQHESAYETHDKLTEWWVWNRLFLPLVRLLLHPLSLPPLLIVMPMNTSRTSLIQYSLWCGPCLQFACQPSLPLIHPTLYLILSSIHSLSHSQRRPESMGDGERWEWDHIHMFLLILFPQSSLISVLQTISFSLSNRSIRWFSLSLWSFLLNWLVWSKDEGIGTFVSHFSVHSSPPPSLPSPFLLLSHSITFPLLLSLPNNDSSCYLNKRIIGLIRLKWRVALVFCLRIHRKRNKTDVASPLNSIALSKEWILYLPSHAISSFLPSFLLTYPLISLSNCLVFYHSFRLFLFTSQILNRHVMIFSSILFYRTNSPISFPFIHFVTLEYHSIPFLRCIQFLFSHPLHPIGFHCQMQPFFNRVSVVRNLVISNEKEKKE